MNDKPLRRCPQCRRFKLERLIGLPNIICRGIEHCKTVGQAAEENTRRLISQHGRLAAEEIIHDKVYGRGGKELKIPEGAKPIESPSEVEVPWWRSGQVEGTGPMSETPITPAVVKDPVRYIHTGEKD